ncbi:uncharacterized protein LOC101741030 [Bombyx mori]|uniref:Cuticle protein n=1 Tax=Bombyx mori TaxID=7091 RepID=A0A8R2API4_BOMMO|nr:uncharacterized protein LOC101741030 [Bombyx mori]
MKLVLVTVLIVVSVQAVPSFPIGDELFDAASSGDWEKVHELINSKLNENDSWKPVSAGSVKSLKPIPGGHVYGESEYTFHSSSDINGQKTDKSGGHKIINDDGKVYEFDFNPKVKGY